MKAAIYNPYLDTLGGGERYTLSFAKVLADDGWQVDIQWQNKEILEKSEYRFGLDLSGLNIVEDIERGKGYELCFWVSDGSIPVLRSHNNILHFQFPFKDVGGDSLMNKMKFYRINSIVCNSEFTKKFIDDEFKVESIVIYPPVDTGIFRSKRKKDIILYVGRFSQLTQAKGQEVLIDVFKKLCRRGYGDWKLVLAGGTEVGADRFLSQLKKQAKNYPVEFVESPDIKVLRELYGQSKIFWSASGYGVDENKHPTKVEHFGISVVEAMSAKCIPVVYKAGGHEEIIKHGDNGFLWSEKKKLLDITENLISDRGRLRDFAGTLSDVANEYSYAAFSKKVLEIASNK